MILAILIAALLLISLTVFRLVPKGLVIGFYGVPGPAVATISMSATVDRARNSPAPRFLTFTDSSELSSKNLKKNRVDILILFDGQAAYALSAQAIKPSARITSQLPSAIRAAGVFENKNIGTPLLLDHFELASNRAIFQARALGYPATLQEFLDSAVSLKKSGTWPILCAGAEDQDLLLLLGSLIESRSGPEAWEKTVAGLRAANDFTEALSDPFLQDALGELRRWRSERLIHPEWLRITRADILGFMENDQAVMVLFPLSFHRAIANRTIERFETLFFPTARLSSPRSLTAPALLAIQLKTGRRTVEGPRLLETLVSPAFQKRLSAATGLAPVNSIAETADKQASDVRFWVAASGRPLPDIGSAAFSEQTRIAAFATWIREQLR